MIREHTEYGIKGIVGEPAKLPSSQSKGRCKLKVVDPTTMFAELRVQTDSEQSAAQMFMYGDLVDRGG